MRRANQIQAKIDVHSDSGRTPISLRLLISGSCCSCASSMYGDVEHLPTGGIVIYRMRVDVPENLVL
jgi:hypothetical protein